MKSLITAALILASTNAFSGTSTLACSDSATRGVCPAVVEVTLNNEALYVESKFGVSNWCPGVGWGIEECYVTGTFKILSGELTVEELGYNEVQLKTRKRLLYCFQLFGPYVCQPTQ